MFWELLYWGIEGRGNMQGKPWRRLWHLGGGSFFPIMVPLVAIVGAVSATTVELLPIPIDDNLTIPLFSAGMMTLAALCFG